MTRSFFLNPRINKLLFSFIFSIAFSISGFSQEQASIIHEVVVIEIKQVSSYTYLLVNENDNEKWLAVPSVIAEIGDVFFYKGGMEMPEFRSKELGETFSSVIFLEKIGKNKEDLENRTFQYSGSELHQGDPKNEIEKLTIIIEPVSDGISIAELFENKKLYEGKTVKIKGQVIKFNTKIMGKNWIHLQDGTEFNGEFDLTFTTNAEVKVGDIVVLEGKITLDKDFGFGYFYDLIVEDSQLITE